MSGKLQISGLKRNNSYKPKSCTKEVRRRVVWRPADKCARRNAMIIVEDETRKMGGIKLDSSYKKGY